MRKRIRSFWQHRPHPLRAIWRWASGHTKRFFAAAGWARTHPHGLDHAASVADRYEKKAKWLKAHKDPEPPKPSGLIVTFDGKPCVGWIAAHLKKARASNMWSGSLTSGYRSPAYSESLCYHMCGAPSCSGTCAGRASNHAAPPTGTGKMYEGAVDVSDPGGFQRYCRAHGNPLHGNGEMLPNDIWHFSRSGR